VDLNERIENFRKMVEGSPNDELGHFSLGKLLMEAGRVEEAAGEFDKVIELNPNQGRAYQMSAAALLQLGQKAKAIEKLTAGVQVAHARGDMMPKNEMLRMLEELGAPAPELKKAEPERPVAAGEVFCSRCGRIGPKLAKPPFPNEVGKKIFDNVCQPCWREWVGQGTKVINEMRLPLADPQAQKIYDQHMVEFLNLR
jgi:Fe-S cluster biosynthesis and repair protein YggX